MDTHIIPCLKDNYAYIIENKKTKNACVVDPSESEPVINFLKKKKFKSKIYFKYPPPCGSYWWQSRTKEKI